MVPRLHPPGVQAPSSSCPISFFYVPSGTPASEPWCYVKPPEFRGESLCSQGNIPVPELLLVRLLVVGTHGHGCVRAQEVLVLLPASPHRPQDGLI